MEEDMIYIERKDGIKYYRKSKYKDEVCDTNINVRINKEKLEMFKKIALEKNIKYQALVKKMIDDYIEENKEILNGSI